MMQSDLPNWPDRDIGKAFEHFVDSSFVRYKGALILIGSEGFKWKEWYPTLELAKAAIDQAFVDFGNSLNIKLTIEKEGKEIEVGQKHTNQFLVGRSPYESFKNEDPCQKK